MFQLHIDPKADVSTGSIPVSWCVDRALLAELNEQNVLDPQVVIITAPQHDYDRNKENRTIVPLKDLMAYVSFKYPGVNTIRAFVSLRTKRDTKTTYLSKTGSYSTWILDTDGVFFWMLTSDSLEGTHDPKYPSAVLLVDIPKACFASEPAAWEKAWVNVMWKQRATDQCDFRSRRMFAYTIQPIIFFFRQLFVLVPMLIAALIGARDFSFRYLLHPIDTNLTDIWEICQGGTIFIRKVKEDEYNYDQREKMSGVDNVWWFVRKCWTFPFMPAILIPLVLLYHFHVLWYVLGFLVCMVAVIAIIGFFASGTYVEFFDWITEPRRAWYNDKREADIIASQDERTMSALPRKTIRLRFSNFKSKVCRPFSG
jgi:hypothetical protein